MESKFSPRVKDVINFSREEALRLGHDYIGAEHLLLGLIREGEGLAIRILKSLGVNLGDIKGKKKESAESQEHTSHSHSNNTQETSSNHSHGGHHSFSSHGSSHSGHGK